MHNPIWSHSHKPMLVSPLQHGQLINIKIHNLRYHLYLHVYGFLGRGIQRISVGLLAFRLRLFNQELFPLVGNLKVTKITALV